MIAQLRGKIWHQSPPSVVIDVHGVGYELEAPMSTIYVLPEQGQEVTLLTHLIVRDDSLSLYGFCTRAERELFLQLLKVSGIGAKIALAVLSGMAVNELIVAVKHNDIKALTKIPGIGKKTAERLVMELRDRLQLPEDASVGHLSQAASGVHGAKAEAEAALVQLGYKPQEASRLLAHAGNDGDDAETLIRLALRQAFGN